jgi:hypothetical protein
MNDQGGKRKYSIHLLVGRENHEKLRVWVNKPLTESHHVVGTCDGDEAWRVQTEGPFGSFPWKKKKII